MDDLETFVPIPRNLTVEGVKFEILPLPVRKISAFARAIRPVAPYIMQGDLAGATVASDEAMCKAVAIATDVEVEWVGGLNSAEFMDLAEAVFGVNADFFVRHVLPKMRVATTRISTAMAEAIKDLPKMSPGDTSLPGSASADTGSQTSST